MAFPEGEGNFGIAFPTDITRVVKGDGEEGVAVEIRGAASDQEFAQEMHTVIEHDAHEYGVEADVDILALDGSGTSSEHRDDNHRGKSYGFSQVKKWPRGMNVKGNWGQPPRDPSQN